MALHRLHASPAAAIAFYDPRLGAVVVASHNREWQVGQVVDVTLEPPVNLSIMNDVVRDQRKEAEM